LEKFRDAEIGDFRFVGLIDRIDSFEPGTIRVVDYKTGRVEEEEMEINYDKADDIINKLFKEDIDKRPGIILQLYVYNKLMEREAEGIVLQNSIYQTRRLFVEEIKSSEVSKKFCDTLEERLLETLKDLKDISKPWRRTQRLETCAHCEFKNICGR
jgi:ATP-dependent helicase/DNAse subunit B